MALDVPGIVKTAYAGAGVTTKSPGPPVMLTYSKAAYQAAYNALPTFPHDIKQAQNLIKQAGADGASGTLMISTPTDKLVGLIVQQTAQQIGIKLTLRTVPFAKKTAIEYASGPKDFDLDLFSALGDTSDPIGWFYIQFDSHSPVTDVAQYKNPTVDKLLDSAWNAPSPAAGVAATIKAQAIIVRTNPGSRSSRPTASCRSTSDSPASSRRRSPTGDHGRLTSRARSGQPSRRRSATDQPAGRQTCPAG